MKTLISSVSLFLLFLTFSLTVHADLLPTDLQPFIARGQLQGLERQDNQYVLTVGEAFHEVSAEQQRAIMRRVLETVSSSDRSARLVAVKGPRGEALGVLSVGSFRRNPNAF